MAGEHLPAPDETDGLGVEHELPGGARRPVVLVHRVPSIGDYLDSDGTSSLECYHYDWHAVYTERHGVLSDILKVADLEGTPGHTKVAGRSHVTIGDVTHSDWT